ncbi:MAG: DUF1501 domain-containing protein [Pirellulales bacterium]
MTTRFTRLSRRRFIGHGLLGGAAVTCGGALSGWLPQLAQASVSATGPAKSVVLLWLNGGPATIDLWDLKPGHANGGPFKTIDTSSAGVRISEHLPQWAKWMKHAAVVRSITSKEGDHTRAHHLARTGYVPQGAIRFPALGSLICHETADDAVATDAGAGLPPLVSIAPSRYTTELGAGFLGPAFAPLDVGLYANRPEDLVVPDLARSADVADGQQRDRLRLLNDLDRGFRDQSTNTVAASIRAANDAALRLMLPDASGAIRLDDEPTDVRDRYGRSVFGQGCLFARRLVERGVRFVEVTLDGWDTHSNNFTAVQGLSTTLDTAAGALLEDLQQRGLLDSTLVVCMGEFGRTPKINAGGGRDHWPQAWSAVLAGGGVRGGQAVGKTNEAGTEVVDDPVRVPDLLATICRLVGIDHTKQNDSNVGRPIRVTDPSAKVVEALVG